MRKALCAVAALLLLTGCSGSSDSGSVYSTSAQERPAVNLDSEAAPQASRAGGPENSKSATAAQKPGEPGEGRAIAYTANLKVRVEKVESATAKAKELIQAAGGYVAKEQTYGAPPSARLNFQVPADGYSGLLDALTKQLGKKVSLEQSAEDVTEQIADVDSRVESAEAALKRLRALLSRANTVGEVLQVSEELDQRQADLDALKARQKSLSQRVKEASITLVVVSERDDEPAEDDDSGFLGGLKAGWDDLTDFVSGLLTGFGWLLPFSPLLIAFFFLGRFLVRRRRARRQAA
ncbi:DUF4349 domain-containing protein [Actinocorallia aurantiaca]|uniref:DUF4349 domain-containing protein n=1 Tax=Actinocorallia aurantiaca TaxID=46204 RepID=A0ABN3UA38_9ACTN